MNERTLLQSWSCCRMTSRPCNSTRWRFVSACWSWLRSNSLRTFASWRGAIAGDQGRVQYAKRIFQSNTTESTAAAPTTHLTLVFQVLPLA